METEDTYLLSSYMSLYLKFPGYMDGIRFYVIAFFQLLKVFF